MAWLALVGQGISMLGGAVEERKNYAAQDRYALDVEQAARDQGEKLRRAGRRAQGQARAQLGASGVDVNTGSGDMAIDELGRDSESDAFNAILTGKRQGNAIRAGAKLAGDAQTLNQASSLLSAAGNYYGSNGGKWIRQGGGNANTAR